MRNIPLILLLIFTACQPEQDFLKLQIEIMEKEAKNSDIVDTSLDFSLIRAYTEFAKLNPEDSISPYYIRRAADILRVQPQREKEAIALYQSIIKKYPKHSLVIHSLFMIGFTYDENLKNNTQAIKCYDEFLKRYPHHRLAKDVFYLKAFLADSSLSDLEKVQEWMKQNHDHS